MKQEFETCSPDVWQCLLSLPEKHSLSPCGCQLVSLGSAVLAMTVLWMQLSWPPSRQVMSTILPHEPSVPLAGLVLGPFLTRVLLVVRRDVLLPWLLCPHRPFSPAIGTVKHPCDSLQGCVRAATMS